MKRSVSAGEAESLARRLSDLRPEVMFGSSGEALQFNTRPSPFAGANQARPSQSAAVIQRGDWAPVV